MRLLTPRGGGDHEPVGPERLEELLRLAGPPENELPVPLALSLVVGRTPDVAVGLVQWQAYSTGVAFTLVVRLRVPPAGRHHDRVFEMLHTGPWGRAPTCDRLVLGFELGDGSRVSNLSSDRPWTDQVPDPAAPMLQPQGGGGGGRTYDLGFWLSPVPPAGPLLAVCSWSAMGVPETQVALDATALREAAGRAEPLWPYEPQRPRGAPERPVLPRSGWFSGRRPRG